MDRYLYSRFGRLGAHEALADQLQEQPMQAFHDAVMLADAEPIDAESKLAVQVAVAPDGRMFYNTSSAPDINTVWTGELKNQYPYVYLFQGSYPLLLMSERPVEYGTATADYTETGETITLTTLYIYAQPYTTQSVRAYGLATDYTWLFLGTDTFGYADEYSGFYYVLGDVPANTMWTPLWANTDIKNVDNNTTYYPASEPTSAVALLACSNLSSTEKVYRIAAWCYPKGGSYQNAELTYISPVFAGPTYGQYLWLPGLRDGIEYELYACILANDVPTDQNATATFTNHGVRTPYLLIITNEITDDGFTVWLLTQNLASDTEYTAEVIVHKRYSSGGDVVFEDELSVEGGSNIAWTEVTGLDPETEYIVSVDIYPTSTGEVILHGDHTVTTAEGTELDFTETVLYLADLEYTETTADFEIGWRNLPERAYPNDVQYFISAELDDGSERTTYLFSSSDPEDGTHWLPGFDDLEPGTKYTMIARLLYNTTGNFSDFTDSGVWVTYEFTTLGGGFDHDSFLLGMASGLGATAATKTGAEYSTWTQGYIVGSALRKAL